jgi:rare lipoprotein A
LAALFCVAAIFPALGGCSFGSATDPNLGVAASPRVAQYGAVPKGGGVYKVGKPYKVAGRWYTPREVNHYDETGVASWYGAAFHGRRTANGEIYDMNALTAGHPTLPLPSYAYVTNLNNGRTILVRINDRGPYVADRLIDLSRRSATELGFTNHGLARVRVRYAGRAPLNGDDSAERRHLAAQAWHEPNRAYASYRSSPISTGAIAVAQPAAERPQWSVTSYRRQLSNKTAEGVSPQRAALGGPQGSRLSVGPFASVAEAERMRHELGNLGPARVESIAGGNDPAYRVLVGPLGDPVAVAAAEEMAGLSDIHAAGAAVDSGR